MDSNLDFFKGGTRPKTAIFTKGKHCQVMLSFLTRELKVVQIKVEEGKDQKDVVVYSAYFPIGL